MSPLTPAIRRQILNDMGIDVWRARSAPGAASAPQPAAGARLEAPRARRQAPARQDSLQPASVPAASVPAASVPAASVERVRAPQASASVVEPDAAPVAPVSVLSMAAGGVVMLIDGEPSKPGRRLAMDVLAAACGNWQAKPVMRRFDWPPVSGRGPSESALRGDAAALGRALKAFVDKDLDDHGGWLLLCSDSLAGQLPDEWPRCQRVLVPPLDLLGREAPLKRALWQSLQQAALRADRASAPSRDR